MVAISGSWLRGPTGRAIASLASRITRSEVPPMPTPMIPGGQGLAPDAMKVSRMNFLTAFTPSAGMNIFMALMFSEPEPLGIMRISSQSTPLDEIDIHDRQVPSDRGLRVHAGDRVGRAAAERELLRRAARPGAQPLLDFGPVPVETGADLHHVDRQAGILADEGLLLVRDLDRLQHGLERLLGGGAGLAVVRPISGPCAHPGAGRTAPGCRAPWPFPRQCRS